MSTIGNSIRVRLRHVITAACAVGTLAFGATANAGVPGADLYLGVGLGQSNADISAPSFDEKDTAWKIYTGARFLSFAGVELDYINFGKPSGGGADVKYRGLAGYGLYYLPIPLPVLDVYVKAGLARVDVNPSFAANTDDTKFAYGAGLQLKFASFAIRGEYERFKVESSKPSLLSVGFSKSFL